MNVVMYLRKSRADLEAELSGASDTLARHRQTLTELAERKGLIISAIYEEVVSGDTIAARPEMQRLLKEVEAGMWDAVLVMEIERLARGDSIDQGIVARAFRYSETKIITPLKIYDPSNEFDEEFLEFGLFMSRREYKTIRRRLTAGVQASRREGKFTGSVAPYGYQRQKLKGEKGYTLIPDPETAPIVRDIFSWYLHDHMVVYAIAKRLSQMQVLSPGGSTTWFPKTVTNILLNPHYAGYTTSSRRPVKPVVKGGEVKKTRPRINDLTLYEGRHEALVSRADWEAVQTCMKSHYTPPVPRGKGQTNAFSGLIYCSVCGSRMQRNMYGSNSPRKPYIFCMNRACPTVSATYESVENLVRTTLKRWSLGLELDLNDSSEDVSVYERSILDLNKKRKELSAREARAFELVETGVYSPDTFLSRKTALEQEQADVQNRIIDLTKIIAAIRQNSQIRNDFIPQVQRVLELYDTLTPREQNELLKTIIAKIVYKKTKRSVPGYAGDMELTIYPRLPVFHAVK